MPANRTARTHVLVAMARGWESKSVEAQQAEAGQKTPKPKAPMSAEAAVRWRERESLLLARKQVLQQMAGNPNPRHLALLSQSLAELDDRLKRLDPGPAGSEAGSSDV